MVIKILKENLPGPFNVISIGHIAYQTLQTKGLAKFCGHSSKGVFVVTDTKRILFITDQKYQGPLTINISGKLSVEIIYTDKLTLEISPFNITCPLSGFEINLNSHTSIWYPTLPTGLQPNLEGLLKRSKLLEELINDNFSNKTSIFTISSNQLGARFNNLTNKHESLSNILFAVLSSKNKKRINELLTKLLGFGEGLTPSGDDFICGFLLAANIWQDLLYPHFNLQETFQRIVATSWENTTTLSANLISCAALGSADERIINCLHWLSGKEASIEFILEELQSYGNSSGIETLAGIQAYIQSSTAFINSL